MNKPWLCPKCGERMRPTKWHFPDQAEITGYRCKPCAVNLTTAEEQEKLREPNNAVCTTTVADGDA